ARERREAGCLERRGDAQVERDAESEEDDERRAAAPGHEAPADPAQHLRVRLGGLELRGVLSHWAWLVALCRPRPSAVGQAIADATDRLDPAPGSAELGPEVVDVGVDRVGRDGNGERPGLIEELVAGERLAGVAQEALEQRELAGAEIDGLAL